MVNPHPAQRAESLATVEHVLRKGDHTVGSRGARSLSRWSSRRAHEGDLLAKSWVGAPLVQPHHALYLRRESCGSHYAQRLARHHPLAGAGVREQRLAANERVELLSAWPPDVVDSSKVRQHRQNVELPACCRRNPACCRRNPGASEVPQSFEPESRHGVVHQHLVPERELLVVPIQLLPWQPQLTPIGSRPERAVHLNRQPGAHLSDRQKAVGHAHEGNAVGGERHRDPNDWDHGCSVAAATLSHGVEHRRRDEVKPLAYKPVDG
mmetsp:Transcript_22707/g.73226  ORF Transcript_22707/g.73226 Transcript_22707/m.73226 type:complete len:266 (+) Transcript_22707:3094-3891(+)